MTTVWFVRHGESEANAGLPTTHPTTTQLTERGHHQAQQIARAVTTPPDLIVTSPYWRTKQTAQPTIARFPAATQQEWRVQEFTYLCPDRYQNTTVHERRPFSDAYWQRCDPMHVDGVGAESFADLMQRVQDVHHQLNKLDAKFVLIFSHGRFMRAFLWSCLTHSLEVNAQRFRQFYAFINAFAVPNGAILPVQWRPSDVWFGEITTAHLSEPQSGSAEE